MKKYFVLLLCLLQIATSIYTMEKSRDKQKPWDVQCCNTACCCFTRNSIATGRTTLCPWEEKADLEHQRKNGACPQPCLFPCYICICMYTSYSNFLYERTGGKSCSDACNDAGCLQCTQDICCYCCNENSVVTEANSPQPQGM